MKKFSVLFVLSVVLPTIGFAWEISAGYSGIGTDFSNLSLSANQYSGSLNANLGISFGWGPTRLFGLKQDQFMFSITPGVTYDISSFLLGLNAGIGFGSLTAKEKGVWYTNYPGDIIDKGDKFANTFRLGIGPNIGYKIPINSTISLTPSIGLNFGWLWVATTHDANVLLSCALTGGYGNYISKTEMIQFSFSLPIGIGFDLKKVSFGMGVNISLGVLQELNITGNGISNIKEKEEYTISDLDTPVSVGFSIGYKL